MESEPSRIAAISDAAGAVPMLRERLRENEHVRTPFSLALDNQMNEPHATAWWRDFAKLERAEFEAEAAGLLRASDSLRKVVVGDAGGA
jgi:hypothetical protein